MANVDFSHIVITGLDIVSITFVTFGFVIILLGLGFVCNIFVFVTLYTCAPANISSCLWGSSDRVKCVQTQGEHKSIYSPYSTNY